MDVLKSMASTGYTTEEALHGMERLSKYISPLGEIDIEMIKQNPSLSFFQKWKLTRQIKNLSNKK